MSKQTFPTPGPWKIKKDNNAKSEKEYGYIYHPTKFSGGVIERTILADLSTVRGRSSWEAAANERLIAASPDLLYAALKLLDSFSDSLPPNGVQIMAIQKLKKAVQKIVDYNYSISQFPCSIDNWKKDKYSPSEKELLVSFNFKNKNQ